MLGIIFAGLGAGSLHVVSGPDHIAAVAPFVTDRPSKGWLIGIKWGIGHSAAVWLLTVLGLVFREVLPIETISGWSEQLVGFTLVAVGIWSLKRTLSSKVHVHSHEHGGLEHDHAHVHQHEGHAHEHAPLGIGTLHGLAGTSHLVGVLPSLALPTTGLAVAYVVAYGLSSILVMCMVGVLIGLGAGRFVSQTAIRTVGMVAASAAIAIGVWWIYGGFFGSAA